MTPFMLYCWQMLDSVCTVFGLITFISFIVFGVCLIIYFTNAYITKNEKESVKYILKITAPVFIIFLTLSILTPTTKQAAIIFGVPMMLNQAKELQADKVPAKLIEYLNLYLDEEIAKKKN